MHVSNSLASMANAKSFVSHDRSLKGACWICVRIIEYLLAALKFWNFDYFLKGLKGTCSSSGVCIRSRCLRGFAALLQHNQDLIDEIIFFEATI